MLSAEKIYSILRTKQSGVSKRLTKRRTAKSSPATLRIHHPTRTNAPILTPSAYRAFIPPRLLLSFPNLSLILDNHAAAAAETLYAVGTGGAGEVVRMSNSCPAVTGKKTYT